MDPRIKGSLLVLLLLFVSLSAGIMKSSGVGANPIRLLRKGGFGANSRKLMGLDPMLDYEYAGPNPKHDSRGKRGGGGNRNP